MFKSFVSLLVIGGLVFSAAHEAIAAHEITGAPKCKACHKAKTGDQWRIWTESAHARAFETLATEEARKIVADLGLGDPQQEDACLKCHTTRASLGGGVAVSEKGKYTDGEGVGCESCHGPGSDYKSQKIMKDSEAARTAGLIMNATADGCTVCHNEESPTFEGFDFQKRWAEVAHPVPTRNEAQPNAPPSKPGVPDEIIFESSVGKVLFPHRAHVEEVKMECAECHHQIHAMELATPHPDYLTSSWISCQICHNPDTATGTKYYKCRDCHQSDPNNIADETLSSKVVTHKNCWACHESGIGAEASRGCVDCHVKEQKQSNP